MGLQAQWKALQMANGIEGIPLGATGIISNLIQLNVIDSLNSIEQTELETLAFYNNSKEFKLSLTSDV